MKKWLLPILFTLCGGMVGYAYSLYMNCSGCIGFSPIRSVLYMAFVGWLISATLFCGCKKCKA